MTQDKISKISGAVFFIGLGILLVTGWWWPGIIVVIAVSSILTSLLANKAKDALVSLIIFGAIVALSLTSIPFGVILGTLIIIGGGWTLYQIISAKKA